MIITSIAVSLVSAGESEGHVMINNQAVCDQGWDDVDAGVLCRMLGYEDGEATTGVIKQI